MSHDLGARIRQARAEAGWTQYALAEAVGVGTPYISKIESGREHPSDQLRAAISAALSVDLSTPGERRLAALEAVAEFARAVIDADSERKGADEAWNKHVTNDLADPTRYTEAETDAADRRRLDARTRQQQAREALSAALDALEEKP